VTSATRQPGPGRWARIVVYGMERPLASPGVADTRCVKYSIGLHSVSKLRNIAQQGNPARHTRSPVNSVCCYRAEILDEFLDSPGYSFVVCAIAIVKSAHIHVVRMQPLSPFCQMTDRRRVIVNDLWAISQPRK
jgi:hypothetical protein